ncbi:class I SAM-dependent methyltransferase [Patescibacteria group bacterium]|nr:class I SAM-dependent methyltransferase [Patescibacteria group bacterium]
MSEYLSLVANSGQVNTPPGSYDTVKEWITHSFLGPHSNVLEVGCSTGFTSIEIARYVQAKCCGLDLHADSVATAYKNTDSYVRELVSFVEGDAGKLPFLNHNFSHVVISGHLPFVSASMRHQHIEESVRVLRPWGYLLTALYFYRRPPPQTLLDEFNREVGTQLEADGDYSYWSNLFNSPQLLLEHESVHEVLPADSSRIKEYLEHLEPSSRKKWAERLKLFNENGSYLNYFVRVHRRLPPESNLMIQIPRGGIYRSKKITVQGQAS